MASHIMDFPPVYIALSPFERPVEMRRARYTSGDAVRGTVRIRPTLRPRRIVLVFHGRCTIEDVDTVDLFKHTLELFSTADGGQSFDILGLGLAPDGRVHLPFEFRFPHTVELPAHGFNEDARFENSPAHLLPPSFATRNSHTEYFLKALIYTTSKEKPTITPNQALWFRAQSFPAQISGIPINYRARNVYCRNYRLDPDWDPDASFLKRWKHHRNRYEIGPTVNFNISAKVSQTGVAGSFLSVKLSLEHLERSASLIEPPTLYLRRVHVRLMPTLLLRLSNRVSLEDYSKGESTRDKKPVTLLNKTFDEEYGQMIYDDLELNELARIEIPYNITPTFKTYNVNLSYVVDVRIWVDCAKEEREICACRGPIIVLSGIAQTEDLPEAMQALEVAGIDAEPPPPEYPAPANPPPSYDERIRDAVIDVS